MKRFLHLGYDDKFYPRVVRKYNGIDDISNKFIVYKKDSKLPLQFIRESEGVLVMSNKRELVSVIKKGEYDVLIIYSLQHFLWDLVDVIPKGKTFIWCSYGYDVYSPGPFGVDYKLINLYSLLPITKKVFYQSKTFKQTVSYLISHLFLSLKWRLYGHKILNRANFFQPVFHLEYELLKKKGPFFKAKEYYPPLYSPRWQLYNKEPKRDPEGAIQLCNSAGEHGNHLDVWERIKAFIPSHQEVILPLSYGDSNYASCVQNSIKKDHDNVNVLDTFVPKADYFACFDRSTYFVHGALRQHAMSNIHNAISAGRKVFLFKNSMDYRYLTGLGYVVFPIDEIDSSSFKTPLSLEDHLKNISAMQLEIRLRCEMGDIAFNEVLHK